MIGARASHIRRTTFEVVADVTFTVRPSLGPLAPSAGWVSPQRDPPIREPVGASALSEFQHHEVVVPRRVVDRLRVARDTAEHGHIAVDRQNLVLEASGSGSSCCASQCATMSSGLIQRSVAARHSTRQR